MAETALPTFKNGDNSRAVSGFKRRTAYLNDFAFYQHNIIIHKFDIIIHILKINSFLVEQNFDYPFLT